MMKVFQQLNEKIKKTKYTSKPLSKPEKMTGTFPK